LGAERGRNLRRKQINFIQVCFEAISPLRVLLKKLGGNIHFASSESDLLLRRALVCGSYSRVKYLLDLNSTPQKQVLDVLL